MQTTIRVSSASRDELAEIARTELSGASLDEALRIVLFERRTASAIAQLDPSDLAGYREEALGLADTDADVREW